MISNYMKSYIDVQRDWRFGCFDYCDRVRESQFLEYKELRPSEAI